LLRWTHCEKNSPKPVLSTPANATIGSLSEMTAVQRFSVCAVRKEA
jgi:hypothetical protein